MAFFSAAAASTGKASPPPAGERTTSRSERWLARLLPRRHQTLGDYRLTQKNIYVLPTRAGLLYALVLLAMLVAAINYQLSLGYALTFLLAAVAMVSMMHTFRNLSQLVFKPGRAEPVHAGQMADWSFVLINKTRTERFAVQVLVPGTAKPWSIDCPPGSEQMTTIALPTDTRGLAPLPRLTIRSTFPIGLWRAWTYWRPLERMLVYPRPEAAGIALPASVDLSGKGSARAGHDDDISALRPYRDGDHPRLIAWKAVARLGSDGLLSKEMDGGEAGELLLDWWQVPGGLSIEQKISRMTRWVIDAARSGQSYALRLPGTHLPASHGPSHQAQCLEALALYGGGGSAEAGAGSARG